MRDEVSVVTGAALGSGRATAGVIVGEDALLMLVDIDEAVLWETRDMVVAQGAKVSKMRLPWRSCRFARAAGQSPPRR